MGVRKGGSRVYISGKKGGDVKQRSKKRFVSRRRETWLPIQGTMDRTISIGRKDLGQVELGSKRGSKGDF